MGEAYGRGGVRGADAARQAGCGRPLHIVRLRWAGLALRGRRGAERAVRALVTGQAGGGEVTSGAFHARSGPLQRLERAKRASDARRGPCLALVLARLAAEALHGCRRVGKEASPAYYALPGGAREGPHWTGAERRQVSCPPHVPPPRERLGRPLHHHGVGGEYEVVSVEILEVGVAREVPAEYRRGAGHVRAGVHAQEVQSLVGEDAVGGVVGKGKGQGGRPGHGDGPRHVLVGSVVQVVYGAGGARVGASSIGRVVAEGVAGWCGGARCIDCGVRVCTKGAVFTRPGRRCRLIRASCAFSTKSGVAAHVESAHVAVNTSCAPLHVLRVGP